MTRDYLRQIDATAEGQHPMAVVLSCIDSRVPAEIVFDMGIGDMFSVRVAGNVVGSKTLASLEYAVVVSGVKLVVVMGHKHCGAVNASLNLLADSRDITESTGCPHLHFVVDEIHESTDASDLTFFKDLSAEEQDSFADKIAQQHVAHVVKQIVEESQPIRVAAEAGQVMIVGAMYDVDNGRVTFLD